MSTLRGSWWKSRMRVSRSLVEWAPQLLDALLDQLNRRAVVAEDHHAVRCLLQQFGQNVQLGVRLDALRALRELPGDGAIRGTDALGLSQVLERLGERARRGAEPLAQVDDRELEDALLGGSPPSLAVLRLFLLGRLDEALAIQLP